jgi:hypothetical protein
MHDDEKLLEEILDTLQRNEVLAIDIKSLLQVSVAQQIAGNQLLQILVDNTNPPPQVLTSIKIKFQGAILMAAPVAGPITLTAVGQTATASVLGFDQFGKPFTGTMPTAVLSASDTAGAIATFDPATGLVTAVANGVDNITATLTTAEGVLLTDTEAVTVAIPVVPPPTPVLTTIKVAFA